MLLKKEKESRVKFNPGLSANRPSNNWALGLNFNPGFFFFYSKAFFQIIFSILFRVSYHQIVDKKNSSEFKILH